MIAIVNYDTLEALPPAMSLLKTLLSMGEAIHYIGLRSSSTKEFLEHNNISYTFLPPIRRHPRSRLLDYLFRAPSFLPRRRCLKRSLNRLCDENKDLVVWFLQVKSAALLGPYSLDYSRKVLTFYEVYDSVGANWLGFDFKQFVNNSTIVVPEYNRAWIIKSFFRLDALPCVVANKPCYELVSCKGTLPESVAAILNRIGETPIFLYQGALGSDRDDVIKVIETIARNRPEYAILILSRSTEETKRLTAEYPNVYHHELIPAPNHLLVTSRAKIGMAVYNGHGGTLGRLNAYYCAPNKIYEYSAYGVPTLGNNIPGLKYSIECNGAGLCFDDCAESILSCADTLLKNHSEYRARALRFYDECDLTKQISNVLSIARSR